MKLEVRKGENREEESWLVEDYGAGMERRAAGGVGRLAPEGNVLAVGKHWALGCWPVKPETKMPPAGKCAPRVFTSEKFALAFLFAG